HLQATFYSHVQPFQAHRHQSGFGSRARKLSHKGLRCRGEFIGRLRAACCWPALHSDRLSRSMARAHLSPAIRKKLEVRTRKPLPTQTREWGGAAASRWRARRVPRNKLSTREITGQRRITRSAPPKQRHKILISGFFWDTRPDWRGDTPHPLTPIIEDSLPSLLRSRDYLVLLEPTPAWGRTIKPGNWCRKSSRQTPKAATIFGWRASCFSSPNPGRRSSTFSERKLFSQPPAMSCWQLALTRGSAIRIRLASGWNAPEAGPPRTRKCCVLSQLFIAKAGNTIRQLQSCNRCRLATQIHWRNWPIHINWQGSGRRRPRPISGLPMRQKGVSTFN